MSLYGALFGGVSGLKAQSSKIGIISDNIANVNTVGFKQGQATFETLVVNSSNAVSYQTGGVRGGTRLAITKQGLLSSTDAPTDIAMSGQGFFVVRSTADGSASDASSLPLFTRAGSFRQDSLGNFINSQGFYLQGWPLDRQGQLPGEGDNVNQTSSANFDSLETVNVESASGVAQSTNLIEMGANLDAGEAIFPGESVTATPDTRAAINAGINSQAIILGDEYSFATQNNLHRGDMFQILTNAGNVTSYMYGGYTVGRDITTIGGGANYGDSKTNNTTLLSLPNAGDLEFVGGGATFIVNVANHGLISGDTVTLAGIAGPVGGTPATDLNTTHVITRIDANSFSITAATNHGQASGNAPAQAALTANTRQFTGNVLNASSAGATFLGGSTPSTSFTPAALSFTITTAATGPVTFNYTGTSPSTADGQFNNLNTLAQAINEVNGLTARVADGRLVVSAEDASDSVTFTNGDATGSATQRGLDWVSELGLADVPTSPVLGTANRRFNSLAGLAALINADPDISATVMNPLAAASLQIRVDDPLGTIQLRDMQTSLIFEVDDANAINVPAGTYNSTTPIPITINDTGFPTNINVGDYVDISGMTIPGLPLGYPNGTFLQVTSVTPGVGFTVAATLPAGSSFTLGAPISVNATAGNRVSLIGESNSGSVLAALGITDPDTAAPTGSYDTPLDTDIQGPRYNPIRDPNDINAVGNNMASGDITAQFSRNIRVYDSLGSGHDLRMSFIKTAANTWAVEIHAIPATDVSSTFPNGIVAYGNIIFNGDGSLRSVSTSLTLPVAINWTNASEPSSIALDFGTAGDPFGTVGAVSIGLTDGLSQFDSSYNVNFANQNGAPVGQLVSVAINELGQVIASYSNGETQALFQLPIADFANPDGLRALSGNVYAQTRESGEVNLREAGTNGTGTVVSAALEQSNVDLAEQLTDMIVAQRAYQANTRVIRTTDELLEQLNQL